MRLFALAFVVLLLSCNQKKEAVEIKFNLPTGGKFIQTMTMTMNMNQEMMGQQLDMKNAISITYHYNVLSDSAGWKQVESTINSVRMEMKGMGEEMRYDSDNPAKDTVTSLGVAGDIFGAMKGQKFFFTINEKGDIGNVSGIEEMHRKMMANVPGNPQLSGQQLPFNEESFRQNLQEAFAAYPGKPVRVGDTWKSESVNVMEGMRVKASNTYTLQSIEGNHATIKVQSQLMSTGSPAVPEQQINVTGNSVGSVQYDLDSGMPIMGDLTTKLDMKLNANGTEVPMKMEMKTEITGKKL